MQRALIYIVVMLSPVGLFAETDWAPVGEADWRSQLEMDMDEEDAVILFEKVTIDDSWAERQIHSATIYRRIRIFNQKAYHLADITVPFVNKLQKIKAMKGRTLWPDGTIFELAKRQIMEAELLSANKLALKQKAFSLSGIKDGCIIEYMFTLQSPMRFTTLTVQREIPLLHYEVHWYYHYYNYFIGAIPMAMRDQFESGVPTPKVKTYHLDTYVVHQPESPENPEKKCVKIIVDEVPPFKQEPLRVNDEEGLGTIVLYYARSSVSYWGEWGGRVLDVISRFITPRKNFNACYSKFASITEKKQYIITVFNWIRKNIKNVELIEDDVEKKPNASVDDVLSHGYGSGFEINMLFYYFLQQRGLKPELAFVADRRDKMVDSEVHEWQFDASVVLLPTRNNKYETFAPAIPDLPAGSIPYYYEGTKVLKIDSTACTWIYLPFSADRANTIKRSLDLQLSASAEPTGLFSEQSTGQFAWMRRSLLRNVDSLEVMESLMEELKGLAPLAEIDSIRYANPDKLDSCFIITCKMRFPKLVRHIGRTYFLQPSNYYEFIDNPLTAEKRESPIVFGFAYDQQETICFRPSPDWLIVSFPGNTSFPHSAGRIEMLYTEVEKVLSIQRNLRLRTIYWKASDYPLLQRYFQKRTLLNNELVVLEKKE